MFLRMRQISGGFLGWKNDETGEKAELVFPSNPKLDRLVELLMELPVNRKAVVFHEFVHSGREICKALEKAKIKAGWLYGGTKDSRALQKQFDDDPRMTVLVTNWRVGGMALNLQVANYCIYYESPVGVVDREQSERRTFREGQTLPGFLIDLVCKGTVDQRILDFHKQGEDVFRALLRDPGKVI